MRLNSTVMTNPAPPFGACVVQAIPPCVAGRWQWYPFAIFKIPATAQTSLAGAVPLIRPAQEARSTLAVGAVASDDVLRYRLWRVYVNLCHNHPFKARPSPAAQSKSALTPC